ELLEADDLIYTRPGKGSFVTAHPIDSLSAKRLSLAVERFRQEAPYYRSLAISTDELLAIIRQEYGSGARHDTDHRDRRRSCGSTACVTRRSRRSASTTMDSSRRCMMRLTKVQSASSSAAGWVPPRAPA